MKYQSIRIMNKMNTIELKDSPHGDSKFYRYEYWGIDLRYILHYVGDCHIFEGFQCQNSKYKMRPFIGLAACICVGKG